MVTLAGDTAGPPLRPGVLAHSLHPSSPASDPPSASGTSYPNRPVPACWGCSFAFSLITLPAPGTAHHRALFTVWKAHAWDRGREGAQHTGCLESWKVPDLNSSGFSMTLGLKQQQQQRNSTRPPPPSQHCSTATPPQHHRSVQGPPRSASGAGGESR